MPNTDPALLDLYLTYDHWKEEHEALYARLLELCRIMKWNPGNYENPDWKAHHLKVRKAFIPFMLDWQRHVNKERKTIYPIAKSLTCGGRMSPVAALEQDDRIAGQFYRSYQQATEEGTSPEDALSRLLQVLMIIAEHFRVEDETVVPAAERLMEQFEYSSC